MVFIELGLGFVVALVRFSSLQTTTPSQLWPLYAVYGMGCLEDFSKLSYPALRLHRPCMNLLLLL